MNRRSSFSAIDAYEEDGPSHQQVRRTRAPSIPEAISIPPTPTHRSSLGLNDPEEATQTEQHGLMQISETLEDLHLPLHPLAQPETQVAEPSLDAAPSSSSSSVSTAPVLSIMLPTLHESAHQQLQEHMLGQQQQQQLKQLQQQQLHQQQQLQQQSVLQSSHPAQPWLPYNHARHSPPHGDPLLAHLLPPSALGGSHGGDRSVHTLQVPLPGSVGGGVAPLMSRNATLRKQRDQLHHPHAHPHAHPVLSLDAVDELSSPTSVPSASSLGLSRSSSYNSLFMLGGSQSRQPSASSSPPAVYRSVSASHTPSLQRSPSASASAAGAGKRGRRARSRRDDHDRAEEMLLQQMQHQADLLQMNSNGTSSSGFSDPMSPRTQSAHYPRRGGSGSGSIQLMASEYAPRAASYSHDVSPSSSHPPSPRSARVLQSLRDSFTSGHSASSHGHHGLSSSSSSIHHPLHSPHYPLHHSQSTSALHEERKESGGGTFTSAAAASAMGMHAHSQMGGSGGDVYPFASSEPPEMNVLTRASSSTSSTARTQTHSPVSQSQSSSSASFGGAAGPNGRDRAFHWTSYLFEPSQGGDGVESVPWQPQPHHMPQTALSDPESALAPWGGVLPPSISPNGAQPNVTYCAVCLSDGCDAFLLPCNHNFHAACILQWVESEHENSNQRLSCPLCRQAIQQFVPVDDLIEDPNGDLLSRFLRVWEKHYYRGGGGAMGSGGEGGEDGDRMDDGDTLVKDGYSYPEKQRTAESGGATIAQQAPATPASSPFDLTVEHAHETSPSLEQGGAAASLSELEPLSEEQAAWQQLFQDVFFIPDSLPDDFIIPNASPQSVDAFGDASVHALPHAMDHAANIAAADGGLATGSSSGGNQASNLVGWLQTPFSLLSSLISAFRGSGSASAVKPPHMHSSSPLINRHYAEQRAAARGQAPRTLFGEASSESDEEGEESLGALPAVPESKEAVEESLLAHASAPSQFQPTVRSAPTMTPTVAGGTAAVVSQLVQGLTHTSGGRAFAPSPLYASMPAIAAYFTSYEMMKQELALSPPLSQSNADSDPSSPTSEGDPRAALMTANNTAKYFVAASSAGAVSQAVKVVLSPGIISLASAFASTAQISLRMGIQFSVFEQTKNAFALYRHRRSGEELNAAEVLVAASLGGVVAASIAYPLQHVLPVQHWGLSAPPAAGAGAAAGSTGAGIGGSIGSLPKPTLLACLGRFLPACVATAVTYEYAYRFIRNRTQRPSVTAGNHSGALPAGGAAAAAAASAAGASMPLLSAAAAPSFSSSSSSSSSSGGGSLASVGSVSQLLVDSIAARTSSLLQSVGVFRSHDEIVDVIPMRAAADAHAMQMQAQSTHSEQQHTTIGQPTQQLSAAASSASSSSSSSAAPAPHSFGGHALPLVHHFPVGLLPPRPRPAAASTSSMGVGVGIGAGGHSRSSAAAAAVPSVSRAPAARATGSLSRSASHPALSSLAINRNNSPRQINRPPANLEPW